MAHVRYFVTPIGEAWHVTVNGASMAQCPTAEAAVNKAAGMANLMGKMGHDTDVMLAMPDRPLELVWTHGIDTYPMRAVA